MEYEKAEGECYWRKFGDFQGPVNVGPGGSEGALVNHKKALTRSCSAYSC